jgi:F-type H+-transporting ATPase subunit b
MDILRQLGELFLEAIPTVFIVFIFYFFLRWAFFGPIEKAMSERSARIEGARAEAARLEALAKQELDAYNEALRKARAEIYHEQEQARQVVLDERARLLRAMRSRAQEEVEVAKNRIAREIAEARPQVELQLPALASEIARAILSRPPELSGGPLQ